MLKWKRVSSGAIAASAETLVDFLAGAAGKNRRLIKACCTPTSDRYLRIYRDAEQIVDFDTDVLDTYEPFITLDIPLAAGQQCKVGFYNPSTAGAAMSIMIEYEEAE